MRDWLQIGIYSTAFAVLVFMAGWYVYHTWSDCLEENSVLTCMRMLSK